MRVQQSEGAAECRCSTVQMKSAGAAECGCSRVRMQQSADEQSAGQQSVGAW